MSVAQHKSHAHRLGQRPRRGSSRGEIGADAVAQAIRTSPHSKIIVCGDFNDTPISYARRVIGQDMNDAFIQSGQGLGISYNQNRFYFRIDHILVSKNLRTYNCTVDRSIKDSDHYPIWCYVTPKG